jgi:hypothetical protein
LARVLGLCYLMDRVYGLTKDEIIRVGPPDVHVTYHPPED